MGALVSVWTRQQRKIPVPVGDQTPDVNLVGRHYIFSLYGTTWLVDRPVAQENAHEKKKKTRRMLCLSDIRSHDPSDRAVHALDCAANTLGGHIISYIHCTGNQNGMKYE
jgi:hypothetical protein